MRSITHSWYIARRHMVALLRQPWWIAISLVQPVVWLFIFGSLFKKVVELPGFGADSYLDFLTPGVIVMGALFGAGFVGMGIIEDIDRGVMDRFLVTPVRRSSILVGLLAQQAVVVAVQSLLIVGMALLGGAEFAGGVVGVLVLLVAAVLLAAAVGALSCALALVLRRRESVIGAVQFVALPLSFLGSTFMASNLAPPWITTAARYNPVNWAVTAGREALGSDVDWGLVGVRLGLLAALVVLALLVATRAFRAYSRSV